MVSRCPGLHGGCSLAMSRFLGLCRLALWAVFRGLLWRVLPVSRVVSAVGATVLHLVEFWCLWWHPLLVLGWFVFLPSRALVHCVTLWVAPGVCYRMVVAAVCCTVRCQQCEL
ncbi:hypothetical protein Taro_051026 [Colocasia esculenta]|uniref:Uncharacterized protein n=1 Tax=Colocasia esculenta TaxID=4460 RepID=A0A843XFK4_COLES|nr:hypothetical protein [Colocasia esculenta]